MSLKKLSYCVVIPHYNNTFGLVRAINSVNAQFIPPERIYVVDDCSIDCDIKSAIDTHFAEQENIQVIIFKENLGPGAARNAALSRCNSDYIAFLDCDDQFLPDKIWDFTKLLERFPSLGYWGHDYSVHQEKEDRYCIEDVVLLKPWQCVLKNPAQTSCVIIRNLHMMFEHASYCEDHQFFYRYVFYIKNFTDLLAIKTKHKSTQLDRPQGTKGGLSGKLFKMRIGIMKALIVDVILVNQFLFILILALLTQPLRHLFKVLKK